MLRGLQHHLLAKGVITNVNVLAEGLLHVSLTEMSSQRKVMYQRPRDEDNEDEPPPLHWERGDLMFYCFYFHLVHTFSLNVKFTFLYAGSTMRGEPRC